MILKIAYRGHLKGRCDIDDPEGNTLFSDVNITLAKRVVSCFNGCDGIENNELDEVSYSDLLQSHNYLQKQIANAPTVQREGWVPKLGDLVNPSKEISKKYPEWKEAELLKIVGISYKPIAGSLGKYSDIIDLTLIELNNDYGATDGWGLEDVVPAAPTDTE